MKVPAIKRYRPDWLKKKTKLNTKSNKFSLGQKLGLAAVTGIPVAAYIASDGPRKSQNMRIEMQKISKSEKVCVVACGQRNKLLVQLTMLKQ